MRLSDILEIAQECNITFQKGKRRIFCAHQIYEGMGEHHDRRAEKRHPDNTAPKHVGVETTADVLRWLWDMGIAAIAGEEIS